jgi:phage regulator Rha-like protein
MSNELAIPEEVIISRIYELRGLKVMIDRDLAELFGVETRVLKQAVRRNINRFPKDFMFEMTKEELESWRSQNVTSKEDKKGLRYAPFCFTEQGVTMLSCVLNSERAIAVNIRIVRTFIKMREMLLTHKDLLIEMEEIRKKVSGQDEKIELIFNYLQQFIKEQETPRKSIGYKRKDEQ